MRRPLRLLHDFSLPRTLSVEFPVGITGRRGHRSNGRGFATAALAPPAAEATGYPVGSMAWQLQEKCLEAAVYRGVDVKAVYDPWLPVDLMQTLFVDVHEAAGCSWFSAIILAVIGIRVVTLPVSIAAIRGSREKALIQPQFNELMEKQKQLNLEGEQEKVAEVSRKLQAFNQKHGKFFMLKGTWNLLCFQMPLYVTAFASMRGFAGHPDLFRGFAMESPLWLDSLALPDPYYLMPCFTAAIMLTNTEIFGSIDTEVASSMPTENKASTAVGGQGTFQKYQKWIMRGSSCMFIPLTCNFPAGVFVFMSTNLIVATLQNKILRQEALERMLEIPPTIEKVTAANAAAAATSSGPRPMTPLLGTLRERGAIQARGAPMLESSRAAAQKLVSTLEGRGSESALLALPAAKSLRASVADAAAARRSLDDVQVNPQFAVRRARPARPGLA